MYNKPLVGRKLNRNRMIINAYKRPWEYEVVVKGRPIIKPKCSVIGYSIGAGTAIKLISHSVAFTRL